MQQPKQITKNQHYVPEFYLKKFARDDGKLEILNCALRKTVKARMPRNVCSEDFFYSVNNEFDDISQVLEQQLQKIETDIGDEYDKIVKRIVEFKQLSAADKLTISTFLSMQYLRGLYIRKQIKKMDESMIKQMTRLRYGHQKAHEIFDAEEQASGETIPEETRERLIEMAENGDYTVETDNSGHLTLLADIEGFRNLFFGKDWTIYVSKSDKKFVTSDNPVVEQFPEWAKTSAYGASFLHRTHYFAMTPDVLIVMTYPRQIEGLKIKRRTLFNNEVDNDKILELNFEFPRKSMGYVYSNTKTALNDIIDSSKEFIAQMEERRDAVARAIARNII